MPIKNNNINVTTLNVYKNIYDVLGNITINNTVKIPNTAFSTNNTSDNSNACILIKDANCTGSGSFYPLKVNSTEYDLPYLYFNSNVVIDSSNLLSELETILENYTLSTSNLIVSNGYINFFNGSTPNLNQGSNGVGLRYSSNNTVQFKDYGNNWTDISATSAINNFADLQDVNVYTNPLLNNQYITYNASSNLFVNSNLSIINDSNPTLSNDLLIQNNSLVYSSNTSNIIFDNTTTRNTILSLVNNTTVSNTCNYLEITNADTGSDPSILTRGTDTNIGIDITATGSGDIRLNASLGNIYTNSDTLFISGFVKNSIYKTSTKTGGYNPETTWNIPINTDIILFNFVNSSQSGTYWANVGAGIDGQKLNLIFNNNGSNIISVVTNFGNNGVIVGSGYSNGFIFSTTGQSTSLVYLGDDIDAWQVLNTGSSIF